MAKVTDCPVMKSVGCPMFLAYKLGVHNTATAVHTALIKLQPENIELKTASLSMILDENTLISLLKA